MASEAKSALTRVGTLPSNGDIEVFGAIVDDLPLPVLVFKGAFADCSVSDIEARAEENGWGAHPWGWAAGASQRPHYHDNTAEILIITRGSASIKWGASGSVGATAEAGDCVFQPPGLFHADDGTSADVYTIGSYPRGSPHWSMKYDAPGDEERDAIQAASRGVRDPVSGDAEFIDKCLATLRASV